jgi:putative aldouronate transport system permease protein
MNDTVPAQAAAPMNSRKSGSFLKEIRKNGKLYLLMLPGIIFIFIFAYLPMGGIIIAFQDFNAIKGIAGSEFVGLQNFRFFVESTETLRVIWNTVFLNVLFISFSTIASVTIAVMLSELGGNWFKRISQSLVILPYFLSWTVVAMFVSALLNTDQGLINKAIQAFGGEPILFYSEADLWPLILVLLKIWHGAGFGSIVYLATIVGINPEIYEAASIDGANRWQRIRYITLPLLKTTVILLTLLALGNLFNGDFGMIYSLVLENVLLYPTTDVIDTYVYRALTQLGDMGMAAAVGFFQSLIGFILVITVNQLARKFSPDSALF